MKYKNTVQVEDLPSGLKNLIKKLADGLGDTIVKQQTDPTFHVTVLYGIKTDDSKQVAACFNKPFTVRSDDEVQYFQNSGQTVAMIRVTGDGLKKLHDDLKKQVGSTDDDYSTYKGHITIAYLKKGRKLPKQKIQSFVWEVDEVVLRVNGRKKKIKAGALKQSLSPSEAIYGFRSWLTTQDEPTIMSRKDDRRPIADKVDKFVKKQKLGQPKQNWTDDLIPMKQSIPNAPSQLNEYEASDNQPGGGKFRRPKMQSKQPNLDNTLRKLKRARERRYKRAMDKVKASQQSDTQRLRQLRGIQDHRQAKKRLRFLKSKLRSQSGEDAKQTQRQIRYYEQRLAKGKLDQDKFGNPAPKKHPWRNHRFTKRRHTRKGRGHTGKGRGGSYPPSNQPTSFTQISDEPGDQPKGSWRTNVGDSNVRSGYAQRQDQKDIQLEI